MKRLISICSDRYTLDKLSKGGMKLSKILEELSCDGFEVLKTEDIDLEEISKEWLIGRHLFFYPMWYDFYSNNETSLMRDFTRRENWENYYQAKNNDDFIRNLRAEILDAKKLGFSYIVMHASHMNLKESYTGIYTHDSMEITKAFVENLNRAIDGIDIDFDILIENNWYPGFNFLSEDVMEYYIKNTNTDRIGFMLDTSHLAHTNLELKNEEEAIDYTLDVLKRMKKYIRYIKGIHLNLSISSNEIKKSRIKNDYDEKDEFNIKMTKAMKHISSIDRHEPVKSERIKEVIEFIKPKYLVHEMGFSTLEELIEKVEIQNRSIMNLDV